MEAERALCPTTLVPKVPKVESKGAGSIPVTRTWQGAGPQAPEKPVRAPQAMKAGTLTGRINRNSAPPAAERPTVIVPPCTSTMPLTM